MTFRSTGFLAKMALALIAAQLVIGTAGAADKNVKEPNPFEKDPAVQTDSLKSFEEFLEIPFLNITYQNMLNLYLRTQADLIMAQYFAKDPLFNNPQIKMKLYQIAMDNVNQSILTGNASMQRVTPETNPKLYKEFNEVAITQGFSKQERAQAYVFRAMGPVNAAATSIFPDRISFYIYDGLEKVSDRYQRMGVIGHELSHVRFKHILKGIQNTIMMLQIAGKFTKMGPPNRQVLERLKDFENNRSEFSNAEREFWTTVFESAKIKSETGNDAFSSVQRQNRGTFVSALEAVTDSMQTAPDMGNGAVKSYLKALVSALSTQPVEPSLIQYFKDLYFDLVKAEKSGAPLRKLDTEELLGKIRLAISNLSQADETSADNGGIITHNAKRVASMDLVFTGADIDPQSAGFDQLSRNDLLKRIEQSTVNQIADIAAMLTPDEFASFLSGNPSQTHPFGRYRWLHMIMRSRQPEVLGLSNHFLRNFLIYDFLQTQALTIKANLELRLRDPQAKPSKEDADFIESMSAFQKMNEQAAAFVEKRVIQLVTDSRFKMDGANPRLTDIFDYLLATKEADAQKQEQLLKMAKTEAERKAITEEFARQWSMKDSSLLKSIRERLNNEKAKATNPGLIEKRLTYAALIADPASTFDQLAKARKELLTDTKSLDRQYRTPWDLKMVLKPNNQDELAREQKVSDNAAKSDGGDDSRAVVTFEVPYDSGKTLNVRRRTDLTGKFSGSKSPHDDCLAPMTGF